MFLLGASGVQVGTRFVLSKECDISDEYKRLIKEGNTTVVTGRSLKAPVRAIPNKMTDEFLRLESGFSSREELEHLTLGALRKAVSGDVDNGSFMAGQIVEIVNEELSVKEIIDGMMSGVCGLFWIMLRI